MRIRQEPLLSAVAFATAIVFGSPVAGRIRAAAALAFPASFTLVVGAAIGAAVGVGVIVGVSRVVDRRALRYAALAAALVAGAVMARVLRTGNPSIDVVEAFHFVEYGLLTLLFYLAWYPLGDAASLVLPVLASLLVAVLDEWLQWFLPARVGELRDLAIDGSAIACGLLFSIGCKPPARFTLALDGDSALRIGRLLTVLILAWSMFFHAAFLGHEVSLAGTATFRSRFTEEELQRLSAERASGWRQHPPIEVGFLTREDQYLSEALWHVARRNETAGAGDLRSAWWENRLLETYYAPALDTISSASRTAHRWPAEQRATVEREVGSDRQPFVSAAEPYRIYLWSTFRFWAANALVIAVVSIVCFSAARRKRVGVSGSRTRDQD